MEKKKYSMQWIKFLSRFGLWFLGIPINIVPVAFKQLNSITVETFPGVKTIAIMAIGDFDFSFISVSVLFILCIEAFFADDDLAPIYRKFQCGSFIYFVILIVLYCLFFFRQDLFSMMDLKTTAIYNSVLIGFTIILGALCNATISMKACVKT